MRAIPIILLLYAWSLAGSCLEELAIRPLGIELRSCPTPATIKTRFGLPDTIKTIRTDTLETQIYVYEDKTFCFLASRAKICLYSMEIVDGSIGCLSVGMSKTLFIDSVGSDRFEELCPGKELWQAGYYDSTYIRYVLRIEFTDGRVSKVIPSWDELLKGWGL
jgi:hypothetical protein